MFYHTPPQLETIFQNLCSVELIVSQRSVRLAKNN